MIGSYNAAPDFVKKFVDTTIKHEGSAYTDIAEDSGGATKYGVTHWTARKYSKHHAGYNWDGNMKTLPIEFAQDLYVSEYYLAPKFNLVAEMSPMLAGELFDTSVNTGSYRPSMWLQELLNVFNNQQILYKDIAEDGKIGNGTVAALKSFLAKRGKEGEKVLYNALNIRQGNFYIELAIKKETQEKFVYGWLNSRVDFNQ